MDSPYVLALLGDSVVSLFSHVVCHHVGWKLAERFDIQSQGQNSFLCGISYGLYMLRGFSWFSVLGRSNGQMLFNLSLSIAGSRAPFWLMRAFDYSESSGWLQDMLILLIQLFRNISVGLGLFDLMFFNFYLDWTTLVHVSFLEVWLCHPRR